MSGCLVLADGSASAKKAAPKPKPAKSSKTAKKPDDKTKATGSSKGDYRPPKDWKKKFRGCRFQPAQSFLKRSSFVKGGKTLLPKPHLRALKYRTEKYGFLPGMKQLAKWNSHSVHTRVKATKFFGLPITVHEKIEPALYCVERRITRSCKKSDDSYKPKAIGGLRYSNTYRGGEVSNHLFGVAIDIDPARNPCCGCVKPWPDHPLCKDKKNVSVYKKTALPKCWINAFERYGFYWLGRDSLQDTMHFEFLGNPDRILP